jgi:hypothetical protein
VGPRGSILVLYFYNWGPRRCLLGGMPSVPKDFNDEPINMPPSIINKIVTQEGHP